MGGLVRAFLAWLMSAVRSTDGFLDEEVPVSLSPYECDELMNET